MSSYSLVCSSFILFLAACTFFLPGPPVVMVEPQLLSIPLGSNGVVSCQVADTEDASTVTWYLAESDPLPAGVRQEGRLLFIDQINGNLARDYTCTASNAHGRDQATVTVDIQSKPCRCD